MNNEPVALVLAVAAMAMAYVGAALSSTKLLWAAMAMASAAFLLLILGKVI